MTTYRRPLSLARLNRRVALGGAGATAAVLSLGSRLGRAAAQETLLIEKESDVPYGQPLAGYSSRVDAVVDLAGDMDLMIPFPDAGSNDVATKFFGGTREEVPEVYRDASPLEWVDEETVPFLILQGAAGAPAVEHSRRVRELPAWTLLTADNSAAC